MKTTKIYRHLFAFILFCSFSAIYGQDVPENIKNLTNTNLVKWASAPEIVNAVKAQNSQKASLDKIKELDKKWIETSGTDDFMKSILSNNCSEYLKSLRKENSYLTEIFVMDDKGANVAMTNKTSDYWQGDEDKFIKSYNNGNGTVHYGKLTFDESSQAYLIQVSVPVVDKNTTIGAVTFGIDYSQVKK